MSQLIRVLGLNRYLEGRFNSLKKALYYLTCRKIISLGAFFILTFSNEIGNHIIETMFLETLQENRLVLY